MTNGSDPLDGALDDRPNPERQRSENQRQYVPRHHNERVETTLRAIADAVTKISGRLEPKDRDDDLHESKAALNQAAGVLMELANKFNRTPVTKPVLITIMNR